MDEPGSEGRITEDTIDVIESALWQVDPFDCTLYLAPPPPVFDAFTDMPSRTLKGRERLQDISLDSYERGLWQGLHRAL